MKQKYKYEILGIFVRREYKIIALKSATTPLHNTFSTTPKITTTIGFMSEIIRQRCLNIDLWMGPYLRRRKNLMEPDQTYPNKVLKMSSCEVRLGYSTYSKPNNLRLLLKS